MTHLSRIRNINGTGPRARMVGTVVVMVVVNIGSLVGYFVSSGDEHCSHFRRTSVRILLRRTTSPPTHEQQNRYMNIKTD